MLLSLLRRLKDNGELVYLEEFFKEQELEIINELLDRAGELDQEELLKSKGKLELLDRYKNLYEMLLKENQMRELKERRMDQLNQLKNRFANVKSKLIKRR